MHRYIAYRRQTGRGIGNVIGKLFRQAMPLIKKGVKFLAPHAFRMGANILSDMSQGQDAMESVKRNAKRTGHDVVNTIVNRQTGSGKKRSSSGHIRKSRAKRRTPHPVRQKSKKRAGKAPRKRKISHKRKSSKKRKSPKKQRTRSIRSSTKGATADVNDVFKYGYGNKQ